MTKQIESITAEDLYFTPIPQREYEMIVEDMIPQGLTIMAGPAKSCKSWLVLDLAIAVATGEPILGKETIGCDVLYLSLEDTNARLQRRMHAMEVDDPPGTLHLAISCPKLGMELTQSLRETLKANPNIRLIIIDTLQMIREGDGNSSSANQYGKDTDDLSLLKKFADENHIAMLIVHHVTKKIDPNDPINDIRGSTGMSATPDAILILRKERLQKNGELLSVSRDLPQWKMHMRFEHFRWNLQEMITEEEMAKEEIPDVLFRIAELIRERGRWEGTMSELLEEVGEKEMPSNVLSRKMAQYGCSVFDPQHIHVSQKRTSKERRYTFVHQPEGDADAAEHDGDAMREKSSLSSLPSQLPEMTGEERQSVMEKARRILGGT